MRWHPSTHSTVTNKQLAEITEMAYAVHGCASAAPLREPLGIYQERPQAGASRC